MIKDVYNNQRRFERWKQGTADTGVEGISPKNFDLIMKHLSMLEEKGSHYNTINGRKTRLLKLITMLEKAGVNNLLNLKESVAYEVLKGESIDDLKGFSAFWRWLMKVQKKLYLESKGKKGKLLTDICEEFNKKRGENSFVYFTFDDLKKMLPYFNQDEQVMLLFMFDTIIRSPTELMNVKVSDLHDDFSELRIREETSKTFGRVIKILLCKKELKDYVKRKNLKEDDFLFDYPPSTINKKLKEIAKKVFGDKMSKAGEPYSKLALYDFRHSGAIHWRLGAYKSKIDALMYRGGWNNLTILNYYTKKIGMQDSIEKQDLLIGVDKNELERQIEEQRKLFEDSEKEKEVLQGKVKDMETHMEKLTGMIEELQENSVKLKSVKGKKQ